MTSTPDFAAECASYTHRLKKKKGVGTPLFQCAENVLNSGPFVSL